LELHGGGAFDFDRDPLHETGSDGSRRDARDLGDGAMDDTALRSPHRLGLPRSAGGGNFLGQLDRFLRQLVLPTFHVSRDIDPNRRRIVASPAGHLVRDVLLRVERLSLASDQHSFPVVGGVHRQTVGAVFEPGGYRRGETHPLKQPFDERRDFLFQRRIVRRHGSFSRSALRLRPALGIPRARRRSFGAGRTVRTLTPRLTRGGFRSTILTLHLRTLSTALVATAASSATPAATTIGPTLNQRFFIALPSERVEAGSGSSLHHSAIGPAVGRLRGTTIATAATSSGATASPLIGTAGASLLRLQTSANARLLRTTTEKSDHTFSHHPA